MNFDMVNDWLNDFSNWGKIFGGLAKVIGNDGALSGALDFIKAPEGEENSLFSAVLDNMSAGVKGVLSANAE